MKSGGRQFPVNLALDVRVVKRAPTWRNKPYELTYLLVDREIDATELVNILTWSANQSYKNPKVISPDIIRWSSLLHPRFYLAMKTPELTITPYLWIDKRLPNDIASLSRLWLQSTMFLAGVTLCAAIIQNRYSKGTIESKLDKLWDAGRLAQAGVSPELSSLHLFEQVKGAMRYQGTQLQFLQHLRALFKDVLCAISPNIGNIETMRTTPMPTEIASRFGFVSELKSSLSHHLKAVIVYGSSISSPNFADIDVLLIVDDSNLVLERLAGTSPSWMNKELNIGVYTQQELITMQQLSGDNLADYGVCVWGEAQVVRKPTPALLARNFSFGAIRQRQQLGMLARQFSTTQPVNEDRKNLNQYFVKIPANVAKGTLGVCDQKLSKDEINQWLIKHTGFDMYSSQINAEKGELTYSLAQSSLATGQVLNALNRLMPVATKPKGKYKASNEIGQANK